MGAIDKTVAIIGCGAMGGAIARGLIGQGVLDADHLLSCDFDVARLASLRERGALTFTDAREALAEDPEVVVVAVKPQVLGSVLEGLSGALSDRLVISIAAGVPIATLESLAVGARVIRAMPNLPIQARSGATALTPGAAATDGDLDLARQLFGALGVAEVMREDQLDVAGAVSGCGPAYFALMVDALTRAGVRRGLPAASCRAMVASTMEGVARQLLESGTHPRAYMEMVTSPGGTTAEGLVALEPYLVEGAYEAVDAALERTDELAGR